MIWMFASIAACGIFAVIMISVYGHNSWKQAQRDIAWAQQFGHENDPEAQGRHARRDVA